MEKKIGTAVNWSQVKLLALDFDGTLTDGFVYIDQHGKESVRCSRRDSLGISILRQLGIIIIVISSETNSVVSERCRKMGVESFSGVPGDKKLDVMKKYMEKNRILQSNTAYMGDDVNDIGCLEFAGVAITVADGHELCKLHADYVTERAGGNHAVREVCDLILREKRLIN
ncbi:MAG: HAD hydrolase family protein [Candidatus Yanofskybacteria bacterium]|nr:HAD hydrolase family protein [Candidatus Yanofskybacteria bacterium]